jgi:hypothetical protein
VQEKLRSKLADSHLTLNLSVIHVARFQFSISRNKERTHLYFYTALCFDVEINVRHQRQNHLTPYQNQSRP